jgi:hypothetical protein
VGYKLKPNGDGGRWNLMDATIKAILMINPEANFALDGDLNINWLGGTEPIPQSEINQKLDQAQYEIEMENLRAERDRKLSETDYLTISDRPIPISDEMTTYRQQLRDLPSQYNSLEDFPVSWPNQPS